MTVMVGPLLGHAGMPCQATGKGNDKGAVEGLVGFARRNFMVPIPRFPTWDALNLWLTEQCRKRQVDVLRGHRDSIGQRLVRDLEALSVIAWQ